MSQAKPLKICLYAFSGTALFFRAFIALCAQRGDAVEWSVIFPQGHFIHNFRGTIPPDRQCYLYREFAAFYGASDAAQIRDAFESGGGLVSALLKDKDGYRWLDKEEQLRRGAAMRACYRQFLLRIKPDLLLFPDLEAVDGFVLLNLCAELGIKVLYYTSMRFLGAAYFAPDAVESLPPYFGQFTAEDREAARAVLDRFRDRAAKEAGARYPAATPPKPSWFRRIVVSEYLRWRFERLHRSEETLTMRITRTAIERMNRVRRRRFEIMASAYFDLKQEDEELPDRYVFFALHYTPESSINGLEPYYVDQLRVVDALLLNMPPGYRLVVKEHPAMAGMRPTGFYRELRRRPGLILAHPKLDSRRMIAAATLVATVSGTVGLESYLLDKPCLLFGRGFFAHLCYRSPALHELDAKIAWIIETHRPATMGEKEIEIAKFLNVGADFVIGDPWFNPAVMAPDNVASARTYLWRHLERLEIGR